MAGNMLCFLSARDWGRCCYQKRNGVFSGRVDIGRQGRKEVMPLFLQEWKPFPPVGGTETVGTEIQTGLGRALLLLVLFLLCGRR